MVNDSLFQVGQVRGKVCTFPAVQHEVKCSFMSVVGEQRTKERGAWAAGRSALTLQLGGGAGRSLLGEITEPSLILRDFICLILCWKTVQPPGVWTYGLVTALFPKVVGNKVTALFPKVGASDYSREKFVGSQKWHLGECENKWRHIFMKRRKSNRIRKMGLQKGKFWHTEITSSKDLCRNNLIDGAQESWQSLPETV